LERTKASGRGMDRWKEEDGKRQTYRQVGVGTHVAYLYAHVRC